MQEQLSSWCLDYARTRRGTQLRREALGRAGRGVDGRRFRPRGAVWDGARALCG
jgi:hypothetical protein